MPRQGLPRTSRKNLAKNENRKPKTSSHATARHPKPLLPRPLPFPPQTKTEGLPKQLRRCLGSTNVIESPNSGIRTRTRRVKNRQDHSMVVRWVAASLLDMEKRFKRIMGCRQMWMLDAKLNDPAEDQTVDTKSNVA